MNKEWKNGVAFRTLSKSPGWADFGHVTRGTTPNSIPAGRVLFPSLVSPYLGGRLLSRISAEFHSALRCVPGSLAD